SMEAFLLHSRQARYYSVIVLAQVLLLHALEDLWERRTRAKWLIAAAFLLQFYCNYIACVANLPALCAVAWLFRRRIQPSQILAGLAMAGVGALPWLIYAPPGQQSTYVGSDPYWSKILPYVNEMHFHLLPLFLLAWPLLKWAQQRRRQDA